jgi:hypothetical protein
MIPQPRRNHPRITVGAANLAICGIIFKDFTHLLNDNRSNTKGLKELFANNITGNGEKSLPFFTTLTL